MGTVRKKIIRENEEFPAVAFGVSSNEKIWKLAWELNRALSLNLALNNNEEISGEKNEVYSSLHPGGDFDYYLMDHASTGKKIPPKAREFRYWLFIKPRDSALADVNTLLLQLRSVKIISLAMDISDTININDWIYEPGKF